MPSRPFLVFAAILSVGISLSACQPQRGRVRVPGRRALPRVRQQRRPDLARPAARHRHQRGGDPARAVRGHVHRRRTRPADPWRREKLGDQRRGLTWTFHLRPEVWSDGQPVTANDFVFAYRRMLDPKTGSRYAYLLYVLKNGAAVNAGPGAARGARRQGARRPHPAADAGAPGLLPAAAPQASGLLPDPRARRAALGDKWASLAGWSATAPTCSRNGGSATTSASRRTRSIVTRRASASTVWTSIRSTTRSPAERRVLRGELDINTGIQPNRVSRLRANPDWSRFVRSTPTLHTYLIFKRRNVAALRDARVRQAISMAIDRDFMADKLLRGGQVPTTSSCRPASPATCRRARHARRRVGRTGP